MGEQTATATGDVTLAQHASVLAAVAEGHPLPDALAWAGVDEVAWPRASAGFRETFAKDPAALGAHHAELALAEDRLRRPVPPIDADAPAWVAFMGCVAAAPDVVALLAQAGLGANDVSRITRAWTGRLARDAALRKRVADLRNAAPVMPAVRPGPIAKLVRAAPPEAAPSSAGPVVAAPSAEAAIPSGDVAPSSSPPAAIGIEKPSYLSRATVDVGEVWAAGAAALPFAGKGEGAAPETVDVSEVWKSGQLLPFGDEPAPAVEPPKAPPEEVGPTGTVDVSEVWKSGQALPFYGPPEAPAEPRPAATVDVSEVWKSGQALPFAAPAPRVELTLEQYASLYVELSDYPGRAETLRRYGLTADDYARLDAEWRARLSDPEARAAFDRARAAYRGWLAQRTR